MLNDVTDQLSTIKFSSDDFIRMSRWRLVWNDIKEGIFSWRIWFLLSWQDIRLRYRRSTLGPFWITLSMAITVYTMGFLYGHLFKMDLQKYYPFLAAGMLTWNFFNSLIVENTNAFIEAESYLKQIKLPYTVFILRVVCRGFIIFLHNIVVIIPILFIFHIKISVSFLFLFPALLIFIVNGICYGSILAILGARYRDVGQIIVSLMQVVFFLTPVLWSPDFLPDRYKFTVELNPFAQFIQLLREPLTGHIPSFYTLVITSLFTLFGMIISFFIFIKVRHRIVYWL